MYAYTCRYKHIDLHRIQRGREREGKKRWRYTSESKKSVSGEGDKTE